MESLTIKAKVASSIITDKVCVVGFADADLNPVTYLTLQRETNLRGDHSQDQYYLEVCGQQYGAYGAVLECAISCARLLITLDPQQSRIPAKTICVVNSTNRSQWADACRAVELLFRGMGVAMISSDT